MQEIIIKRNDGGQRLDKFLLKALPSLPPSLLYKAIRTKKIKVNRKRAEGNQILCEGDTLQLFLAPEFFENGGKKSELSTSELSRVKTDLSILYEDEHILLIIFLFTIFPPKIHILYHLQIIPYHSRLSPEI